MRGTRQFFPPLLKSTMLRKRTIVTYLRVIDLVIVAPPLLVLLDVNNNFNHPSKMFKKTLPTGRGNCPRFLLIAMYIDAIELFLTPMIYLTI